MEVKDIFEYVVRNKVRFPYNGNITAEDLWDLPVTGLDNIFKTLNSQAKQSKEESLLDVKSNEDEILDIQIAVVKHIVGVKLEEKAAKERKAENRAKKQKIMEIMAARNDKMLENASDEDLQKMLAELEGNI